MKSALDPLKTSVGKQPVRCIAFEGQRRIASGDFPEVARKIKKVIDRGERAPILVFDEITSRQIEIDFRGTIGDVLNRLAQMSELAHTAAPEVAGKRGPGRPWLGVVAREVTLLPRHWDWLNEQPGGASVALRKLVEESKRTNLWKDRARESQEAVHRFMFSMSGNFPNFEEASRAFYRRNSDRFDELVQSWPRDIRDHLKRLVAVANRDEAVDRE